MGTHAGIWKPSGSSIGREVVHQLVDSLAPRQSGGLREKGTKSFFSAATDMALLEDFELVSPSPMNNIVVTWDGRIDNREEIVTALGTDFDSVPDLILHCYLKWGAEVLTKSLARRLGTCRARST